MKCIVLEEVTESELFSVVKDDLTTVIHFTLKYPFQI